jgi:hypothetical protein
MSEINNLNLNENNKIIEGFSPDIVQKATAVFNTLKNPLDNTIKNFNFIVKSLKKSFEIKQETKDKIISESESESESESKTNIFNKNEQKLLNQSMLHMLFLKKIVTRVCILSLSYAFMIKKIKPQIITRSLKNGNKKALLNFKLAAKIKQKAIVKALRDIKFGKIRAKKIPKKINKNKKKKIIPKTEKILMNYSAVRKDQNKLRKIKLPTVKYESSPLKIAALCFALYMVFSYIYFKL